MKIFIGTNCVPDENQNISAKTMQMVSLFSKEESRTPYCIKRRLMFLFIPLYVDIKFLIENFFHAERAFY